jgi:hypothetical protein
MSKLRQSRVRGVLLFAVPVACAFGWSAWRSEAQADEPVLSSAPLFGNATISGFVVDARSGRPVKGANIAPEPDFGPTQANQQGLYVIDAGYTYGLVTLRASAPGFRQVKAACVALKPGSNGFGDVAMIRADTQPSDDCSPACGKGEQCLGKVCVSECDPVCPCNQICSGGQCVDNPDLPAADSCGPSSKPLGGGACGCKPGFVPNATGTACVEPNPDQMCPQGAMSTAFGCQCTDGKIYSEDSGACLPADEAAIVKPIGDGTITAQWLTPTKSPIGLAFDGQSYWLADNVTQSLYSIALEPGAKEANVLSTFELGDAGRRVIDVDVLGGKVFLLLQAQTTQGSSEMLSFDPTKSTLTTLTPPEAEAVTAGISDGVNLYTLSSFRGFQVRDKSGAIAAPARQGQPAPGQPYIVTPLSLPQGYAGARYGAFTENQFLLYSGTTYDTISFRATFQVFNAVNRSQAKTLRPVTVDIPGSHVRGFDAYGSTGWVVVSGAGIEHAIIAEVHFAAE